MTLKTIEDLALFLGGKAFGPNNLLIDLEDGTILDFRYTVNGLFQVQFNNDKMWTIEFEEGDNISKRLLRLYGKLA